MRWSVFAAFAFILIVVQVSVRNVFTLEQLRGLSPDLVACLVVFVALFAHRSSVLWACWILGMLMDLAPSDRGLEYHLLGPHALGYVAGGYLILQLRTMVFRRRMITMAFLTFTCLVATALVAVSILVLRSGLYSEAVLPTGAFRELLFRFGIAIYSALLAMPVGWLLNATMPLWGFQSLSHRRASGW